jgi:hypothetical protein
MANYERIDVSVFYLYNKSVDGYLGVDEDDELTWLPTDNSIDGTMIHVTNEVVNNIIKTYTVSGLCYSDESVEPISDDTEDDYEVFLSFTHRIGGFINDDISDVTFVPIQIFYRESGVSLRYNNLSLISSANNFTIYQKIVGEYFTG